MDQLILIAATAAGLALGGTLTMFYGFQLVIKEFKELGKKCDDVVREAHQNLTKACEVNQALVAKIETLEDSVKTLDFWRTQGKK